MPTCYGNFIGRDVPDPPVLKALVLTFVATFVMGILLILSSSHILLS